MALNVLNVSRNLTSVRECKASPVSTVTMKNHLFHFGVRSETCRAGVVPLFLFLPHFALLWFLFIFILAALKIIVRRSPVVCTRYRELYFMLFPRRTLLRSTFALFVSLLLLLLLWFFLIFDSNASASCSLVMVLFLFPRFHMFFFIRGRHRAIHFSSSMFYIVVGFVIIIVSVVGVVIAVVPVSRQKDFIGPAWSASMGCVLNTHTFLCSFWRSFFVDFHCCSVFYFFLFAAGPSHFLDGVSMLLCRWLNEFVSIAANPCLLRPTHAHVAAGRFEWNGELSRTSAAETNTRDWEVKRRA